MTSNIENAGIRPLADRELDSVCGGFTLIELRVQIDQIAIIIGLIAPAPQKVRNR